jgi:ribosome biogenesis protein Nip4
MTPFHILLLTCVLKSYVKHNVLFKYSYHLKAHIQKKARE